jgi:hypothetical protein
MHCAKTIGLGIALMWGVGVLAVGLATGMNWLEDQIGTLGAVAVLLTTIGVLGGGAACIASRR